MKFTMLPVLLLFAPIMAQSSVQLLKATVGGSAPIRCSLPGYPLRVQWFYWQEDKSQNILYHWNINGRTQQVSDKYKKRVQALSAEFSSGNFSIRLDNVTVGDDEKTFWARACVYDGQKSFCTSSEQRCDSRLQVSALYRDLHLTVNNTAKVATCTARGGYPAPQVSWMGQNKSSGAHLDLQDAETSLQQDPSEETFSVTSSVSVKDLQSVTCLVYNPRCNQKIHKTSEVDAPDENQQMKHKHIPVIIFIIIITLIVFLWRRPRGRNEWKPLRMICNTCPVNTSRPNTQLNKTASRVLTDCGPHLAAQVPVPAAGSRNWYLSAPTSLNSLPFIIDHYCPPKPHQLVQVQFPVVKRGVYGPECNTL